MSGSPDFSFRRANPKVRIAALERQAQLTKPAGSLGALEALAVHIAALQGQKIPQARPAACLLFAANHPVTRHKVSAYPAEVTAAMVHNFARGGAAANVLARQHQIPIHIHNVGVEMEALDSVKCSAAVSLPVGDLRFEDAMPPETFEAAWDSGVEAVNGLDPTTKVLILGEMGIGNTTVASALAAALLGCDPAVLVGSGTGIDEDAKANKAKVIRDAVKRISPDAPPLEKLRKVGGRELVAMAAAAWRASQLGIVVLLDGFIVSTAVLAATMVQDEIRACLVAAHRSREPGHRVVLDALDLSIPPLLSLDLALGEASGALLAYPILESSLKLHAEMATFASAEVPSASEE